MDENELPENAGDEGKGMKFIVEPSRRKSIKKVKITMEGKLNIYNSAYILKKLKEVAVEFDTLDLRLNEIEELDVSVMQTLHYFSFFYNSEEKQILLQLENPSKEVKALLTITSLKNMVLKMWYMMNLKLKHGVEKAHRW